MIKIEKNKILLKMEDVNVKIPSQLFPLNGPIEIFDSQNTENCQDEHILTIYDSIKPEIGRCYTNTERLYNAFLNEGINTTPYVGWMFTGEDFPVHHAFLVYENKYVFDFVADLKLNDIKKIHAESKDDARIQVASFISSRLEMKNSERFTNGKVDPFYFYVASKCMPDKGIEIFRKLMKSHPKHPAYEHYGVSKTQELIFGQ